jgi:ubiquinone/menaquinone biosynthesis C-methylase UbiE
LVTACRHYFYKPYAAFYNAFHLRAFTAVEVQRQHSVLDVGCFDGEFGLMLTEALGPFEDLTGLELSADFIRRTGPKAKACYREMVEGNATKMPFADDSFHTVLFCASLISILPGPEKALEEARRVLKPGGNLILTVCTDSYDRCFFWPNQLRRLRLHRLADRLTRNINTRMNQFHRYSPDVWRKLLESHGFQVNDLFGFFSHPLCTAWSILIGTRIRGLSLLKLLPLPGLHRAMTALSIKQIGKVYAKTPVRNPPEDCGYLMLSAKAAVSSPDTTATP